MRIAILAVLFLLVSAAVSAAQSITLTVDATDAPDLQAWGDNAKAVCEKWYPIICAELASDGFTPPTTGKIVFKKTMTVPAATGGGTISVNADYVRHHMDDVGMMVHELTHIIQSYHRTRAGMGWMTEGIADYIRWHKYEPGMDHSRINPKTATYHDSYRTTARFLAYVAAKYDKSLVTKLNAEMRKGECSPGSFKEIVGKDVDDLWEEFIANLDAEHLDGSRGANKVAAAPAPARDPSDPKSIAIAVTFSSQTRGGVVEAIWDDGLVVFAADPAHPGKDLRTGRITTDQVRSALTDLWAAGYFTLSKQPPTAPDEATFRMAATREGATSRHEWSENLNPSRANVDADSDFRRFAKIWVTSRTIAAFARPKDFTPLDQDHDALKRYAAAQAANALP
jgi:hypothetical protein